VESCLPVPPLVRDSGSSFHERGAEQEEEEEEREVLVDGEEGLGQGETPAVYGRDSLEPAISSVDPQRKELGVPTSVVSTCFPDPQDCAGAAMQAQGKSVGLPKFDFESPGHRVLDLRGTPLRTESRLESRLDQYPTVVEEQHISIIDEEGALETAKLEEDDADIPLEPLRGRTSPSIDFEPRDDVEPIARSRPQRRLWLRTSDSVVSVDSGVTARMGTGLRNLRDTTRARSKVRKLLDRVKDRTEVMSAKIPLPPLRDRFGTRTVH
jgi:hypothetical protein